MEITSKLSDLVVMQSKHTRSYLFHKKKLANDLLASQNLIGYNSNDLEENEEEEKETIYIEFTEQKAGSKSDENAIDFRWLDGL